MTEFFEEEIEEETWAIRPNKSQIKRDIAVIRELCEEVIELPAAQIERLGLPDNIVSAVLEAAKMPLKGARKRQLKYITGLVRKIDLEPIQENLAKIKAQSAHAARELHQLERWRDRLLAENSKQALTDFLKLYPNADAQQLRQLIRNSAKETATLQAPKSSRLLFKYLREVLENKNDLSQE